MKKALMLIVPILSLNLLFGYLFQLNNRITCLTELSFLGLAGLCFWALLYLPLCAVVDRFYGKHHTSGYKVLTLAAVGLAAAVLNLFFCQFFVVVSFDLLYGCIPPSFDTLQASLTNNIAGNLLCFLALTGLIINEKRRDWHGKQLVRAPEAAPDYLLLSHSRSTVKVSFNEISHVVVSNNCITIHTTTRQFVRYQSLKSFQQELPAHRFRRVHRSAIVNINFIREIETNHNGDGKLHLSTGATLRFSRNYKQAFVAG